jgi:hypothetical protein
MDQNSPWGMVLQSASEWDIRELHKGGVAFLRIDFRWEVLQPTANTTRFAWLHYDRLVRWATDRGMWILAGLGGTPQWAVDPGRMSRDGNRYRPDAYPPQNLALWENYVREVVRRYSARGVRYWGIWNEPDSFNEPANVCFWRGDQPEFFNGVFALAVKVLQEFPGQKICAADLAKSKDPGAWLNPLLSRFGRSMFAATIHAYNGTGDGSDIVDRAAISKRLVDSYNAANGTHIELWITETGWHSSQHAESTISDRMKDLVREVRAHSWLRKVFPYVWVDDFNDASFKETLRATRLRWTGYSTAIAAPQPVVPLERDSLLVSHNVPLPLTRGTTYNLKMTFRNTGRWAWPKQSTFRLGFASVQVQQGMPFFGIEDLTLPSASALLQSSQRSINAPSRVQLLDRAPVAGAPAQGETTFSFTMTTPTVAGYHMLAFGLVDERPPGTDTTPDSMWFGQGLIQRSLVG